MVRIYLTMIDVTMMMIVQFSTVSSILSGPETRSLGFNTLGTT